MGSRDNRTFILTRTLPCAIKIVALLRNTYDYESSNIISGLFSSCTHIHINIVHVLGPVCYLVSHTDLALMMVLDIHTPMQNSVLRSSKLISHDHFAVNRL